MPVALIYWTGEVWQERGVALDAAGRLAWADRPTDLHPPVDSGFVPGTVVTLVKRAPFGDPLEFQVRGCHISLRAAEARCILAVPT